MSMWLLYLLIKLDAIGSLLGTFSILTGFGVAIFMIVQFFRIGMIYEYYDNTTDDESKYARKIGKERAQPIFTALKSWNKKLIPLFLVLCFANTMMPSTKEFAFIYVAGKLTQSEQMQKLGKNAIDIPDKALQILNIKMNEYVSDAQKQFEDTAKATSKEVVKAVKEEVKGRVNK